MSNTLRPSCPTRLAGLTARRHVWPAVHSARVPLLTAVNSTAENMHNICMIILSQTKIPATNYAIFSTRVHDFTVQKFNLVLQLLLHNTFVDDDRPE